MKLKKPSSPIKKLNKDKKQGLLIERSPYHGTPSFIKHNGKCLSVLQLYVRSGSNRNMSYDDVIGFIPISTSNNVQVHLVAKDSLIKDDAKKKVIRDNASVNKKTISNTKKHAEKKDTEDNNESAETMRQADFSDYNDYESILDSAIPIVVFRWLLIVVGDNEEDVDNQISDINTSLDQLHEGAKWDSLAGEQLEDFTNLFEPLAKDRFDMTSTGTNYGGLNLAINSGLFDPTGIPIGVDTLSLSGSVAYFDFEKSTQTQSIIAMPRSSYIPYYVKKDETKQISASSIVAQACANQVVMEGKRVHHIVLNDFNYFEPDTFFAPRETSDIFTHYDMMNVTINPLQGFGEIEDVVNVFARLIQKNVNIFDILQDFNLDMEYRGVVLKTLEQFFISRDLWHHDADKNPYLTQILGREDNSVYPTMSQVLNSFTSLYKEAEISNREAKADRIEALESSLRQTMTTYRSILDRPTTIQPTNASQVYYMFNKIEQMNIKQVQFVNILDYVIYTAKRGDLIVIHGYDNVLTRVAEMVETTITSAKDKGIRFLYAFDSLESPTNGRLGKMNDMFEMQSTYYVDLDTDVDWVMIGKALPNEVDLIRKSLNKELSATIEQMLQVKSHNQVLVHRHIGDINNFVQLNVIV